MDVTASASDVAIAVLSIITAALGFVIKEQREKIKKVQEQLSEKKYIIYHETISIVYDLLKMQKKLMTEKEVNLVNRLMEVKKDLILYAPDNVLKKFFEWNSSLDKGPQQLKIFLDLFVLIRKDMGHKKSGVTTDEILRSIMMSDKDFNEIKEFINSTK